MSNEDRAEQVNLPPRPFLYTLDQVQGLLSYETMRALMATHILFFVGRQPGRPLPDEIRCINIARVEDDPDWRVEQRELVRWLKRKGFRYIDR